MPVVARFYGIVIEMYFQQKEHNPPHVHAFYGECAGTFSLAEGEMIEGDIPVKEQTLIKGFIENYREELYTMWRTQKFRLLPLINE